MELPLAPRQPSRSPDSATGGCPPPSLCHINRTPPPSNEEGPFPQPLEALFERVLRKKHAGCRRTKVHTDHDRADRIYLFVVRYLCRNNSANLRTLFCHRTTSRGVR